MLPTAAEHVCSHCRALQLDTMVIFLPCQAEWCVDLQGFSLKLLKHLVLDEADRLLNMDFEQEIDQILKAIPKVACCVKHDDIHLHSVCAGSQHASQLCGLLCISSTCLPSPIGTQVTRLK